MIEYMGMRTIIVHRRGYFRKGTWIKPTTFEIKDRGTKGKGKKLFQVKRGAMTRYAIKLGYIKDGQKISDIPNNKIDDFARDLKKLVGKKSARAMFQTQVLFRKRAKSSFKRKMEIAAKAV